MYGRVFLTHKQMIADPAVVVLWLSSKLKHLQVISPLQVFSMFIAVVEVKFWGNDQNKPYGLLSDPTSMILYLCKSDWSNKICLNQVLRI